MLSFVHGSCVTLKHCAPVQKKHAGSESRCRHVTAQLFLEPLEFPKYILKNRHWRNYTQGHFYNKTIACCWDMKRVTLHYIFSTLTKYTLDMRWFMMLGNRCPPASYGLKLPILQGDTSLLQHWLVPWKKFQEEMRTILLHILILGCHLLTVASASPDVTHIVQKVVRRAKL